MLKFLSENVNDNVLICAVQCTRVPSVYTDYVTVAAINRQLSLLRSQTSVMRTSDAKLRILDAMPRPHIAALENTLQTPKVPPHRNNSPLSIRDMSHEAEETFQKEIKLIFEVVRSGTA